MKKPSQGYYSFPSVAAIAAAAVAALWFLFSKRENQTTKIDETVTDNNTEASTSASASSVSPGGGVYDVFLSFCGKDTRDGFTDFLYTYLVGASIKTFRDDNELRVGNEISSELLNAITQSKISIPILSRNYASSKWCLLELQQIVECHKRENGGQMIYPIFYDVDPSDVRNQRGSYKMAFKQHKKNFSEETVQKWRKALRTVGELKGLELEKETDGRQGELVKRVVEKVLLGLKKNYTHLPENLVGMDKHTENLMALLDVDSNDVHVIGIVGMGGLGKTTIAKVIFNNLCEQFESQCFLADVREKSKSNNGIVDLQKQIISTILNRRDDSFSEVDEGRRRIINAICGKRILLVLDDVDEISQVKSLTGDLNGYGAQSRVILTTREKKVLDFIESTCKMVNPHVIYRCYEPDLMGNDYALELFCKYAFMRDTPKEGYEIYSTEVVSLAAGLPLVLVVLGSAFFNWEGYEKDLWEEKLRQLRRVPDNEVLEKLRISFDTLQYPEKQIFLDIACFFIGDDWPDKGYMRKASYLWEDCRFSPKLGIRVLISKSLIKVGDDDEFVMHDHLRDLGRQIVFEEGKNEPWKRSRLWDTEDVLQTLETSQGTSSISTNSVSALRLECKDGMDLKDKIDISVVATHFQNLPNLRYLHMDNVADVLGDFNNLLPNLRWFRCRPRNDGYFFPENLNTKNLVILDLYDSVSRDDWDGWNKLKMIKNLKYLNLSGSKGIPALLDLSNLTKLVEVHLSYCVNLIVIQGLDKLQSLKRLDASSCYKLIQIEGVQKLISLEYLNLRCCNELKGLGDLSNLKKLQVLKGAPGLDTTDFSNLKKLKQLEIIKNNRIEINLYGLEALEELEFFLCPSVVISPNLSSFKRLKSLTISKCSSLVKIKGIAGLEMLHNLAILDCNSLERLTDLQSLKNLEHLHVISLSNLTIIDGLEELISLLTLQISGCSSIEALPDFSACQKLKSIYISGCSSIEALPDLSACQKLEDLGVSECEKLTEILGLEELISLEKLSICMCISIEALPDLSACQKLTYISVYRCKKLTEILGLEELKSLNYLDVSGCKKLSEILGLEELKSLTLLDVSGCEKLSEICGLEELKSLTILDVSGCEKLSEIHGLEELISLERLNISRCSSIEALPDLSTCQKLKYINVSRCVKISEILGLEELKSLTRLDVRGCEELGHLPNLANVEILQGPPDPWQ